MRYLALACDYDGTLAAEGRVSEETIQALERLRETGRKLILVTGRELEDLKAHFSRIEIFERVVAENGAVVYTPKSREEQVLGHAPPESFTRLLQKLAVQPISCGRIIVSTWEPHEKAVLEAIRELALELHIVFNKGAVMVLPGNVNKAWGLKRAIKPLRLSMHNVVGIGDAENDQAFLSACGCAAAVANALPSVKARADLVVPDHGAGVIELARLLTESDLRVSGLKVPRVQPVLGTRADNTTICLSPFETTLVTGGSGAGKSTIVTALLEQIRDLAFQFCVVDPEGDYSELPDAVVVGDAKQEPRLDEVMSLLAKPDVSVVVNLLAIDPPERPRFLAKFLPEIAKLRSETGRPHWIVLDEAHHCLPAKWDPAPITLPSEFPAAIAVTVHPEELAPHFLEIVSTVIGVGDKSLPALERFCRATGRPFPPPCNGDLTPGAVYLLAPDRPIEAIIPRSPKEKQKRHARKYAEGELGEDKSFYFRGADDALNLRAQNLSTFLQMAAGVDDKTWLHHLQAQEYSRWFRDAIKDDDMARETRAIEEDRSLSARASRLRIKDIIDRRYTAPAKKG